MTSPCSHRAPPRHWNASGGDDIDERLIDAHFGGGPVSEIDLVIRASGEQRLSGVFPWQSARAEVYVSPKMWPAFTERDLDSALSWYAACLQPRD